MRITSQNKKSISLSFDDHLQQEQWINLVEWENGEGYDVSYKDKMIELSFTEIYALIAAYNLRHL